MSIRENYPEEQTVDVVIPSYKPGAVFISLLERLKKQTYPIHRIIVMNTEKKYWDEKAVEGFGNLEVHHLSKAEFDHGATRNRGAGYSGSDFVIFMTDDAMPADTHLVEELVKALLDGRKRQVAAAYARQLAGPKTHVLERITRDFNYPDESRIKDQSDLKQLGIKTYFASNVCCAYDRKLLADLGGFPFPAIFNEDMIFAGHAVRRGYAIAYAAEAKVIHAHNYTGLQQLHRNFDLAVSQADHPEIFKGIRSEGEGIRLVKKTASILAGSGKWYVLPKLFYVSGLKYLGYLLGKNYKKLPARLVLWCTMNREYWNKRQEHK